MSEDARDDFALYLEVSGPRSQAEAARGRAGETRVAAVRDRWSGVVMGPNIDRTAVLEALGPPDQSDAELAGYRLSTRPGYLYVFSFDPQSGRLVRSGFQRLQPRLSPPAAPFELLTPALVAMEATLEELEAWYGKAVAEEAWWPIEIFTFANGLRLQLQHGVAE